jgi:hypothetical protein
MTWRRAQSWAMPVVVRLPMLLGRVVADDGGGYNRCQECDP